MSRRSPERTSSPATGSTCFSTGVLSPVRAASSISSVAATSRRPSAGILSPASKWTTSPGTTSSDGNVDQLAAAAGMGLDDQHLLERGDALGGLALLIEAEDRVEHGQADDHDAGGELLEGDDADDRGAEQDELHQVAVLAQKRLPAWLRLRLRELVRARPAARRRSTSPASSPRAGSTPSCAHASSAVTLCHTVASRAMSRLAVTSAIRGAHEGQATATKTSERSTSTSAPAGFSPPASANVDVPPHRWWAAGSGTAEPRMEDAAIHARVYDSDCWAAVR